MAQLLAKTKAHSLRQIVQQYRDTGQEWPATARQIAAWAYSTGRWEPCPTSVITKCAEEISRAMREEYYVDPQGRTVRTKHAAPPKGEGKQQMFWDDIRTADPEHMEGSLRLRRNQIAGECTQLKRDQDSYNDNNSFGAEIQLSFDFKKDVIEAEAVKNATAALRKGRPR